MKRLSCLVPLVFLLIVQCAKAQSVIFTKAMDAYKKGEFEAARTYLGQELEEHPDNGGAYLYLALIEKIAGNYSAALKNANLTIKYYPKPKDKEDYAYLYEVKGDAYYGLAQYESAITEYTTALKYKRTYTDLYLSRGRCYYNLGKYTEAIADFQMALTDNEVDPNPLNWIASSFIRQEKYDEALQYVEKAIAFDETYSYSFVNRAIIYDKTGRSALAVVDIIRAMQDADNFEYYMAVFLKVSQSQEVLTIAKLTKLINSGTNTEVNLRLRAAVYNEHEKYKSAAADFTRLLSSHPDNIMASTYLWRRGACYKEMGMYNLAIDDLTASFELDTTDALVMALIADCYRLSGDFKQSVATFQRAIDINPESGWLYYRKSWTEEMDSNYTASLADINVAIELDSSYAYSYLQRAGLYEKFFHNMPVARKDYESILLRDTAVVLQGNCRQYALARLGRGAEARAFVHQILQIYPNGGNYYDAACTYSLLGEKDSALYFLNAGVDAGFRDIHHAQADDELDAIHGMKGFQELVLRTKKLIVAETGEETAFMASFVTTSGVTTEVPLTPVGGGVYELPCEINGLKLKMIFDTGASDVCISSMEANFMLRNGYLSNRDIVGSQAFLNASGDIEEGAVVLLKTVRLGQAELKNVKAMVVKSENAPLLFGQSALSRFAKYSIDLNRKVLSLQER